MKEKQSVKSAKKSVKNVPRMSITRAHRHLTKADIYRIPQKERIAMAKRVLPGLFQPPRLRKLVRLAVQKAHGKKLANALDALLVSVDTLYDLEQQDGAHNPHLFKRQRSGAIRKELHEAQEELSSQWKKLYMLV